MEYVGIARGKVGVRGRINHLLIQRDTPVDADRILHVSWWLDDGFTNDDYLRVAEQVAFDVLNPFSGRRPAVRRSQDLENIENLQREMEGFFSSDPSGCYFPATTENMAHCISRLGDHLLRQ